MGEQLSTPREGNAGEVRWNTEQFDGYASIRDFVRDNSLWQIDAEEARELAETWKKYQYDQLSPGLQEHVRQLQDIARNISYEEKEDRVTQLLREQLRYIRTVTDPKDLAKLLVYSEKRSEESYGHGMTDNLRRAFIQPPPQGVQAGLRSTLLTRISELDGAADAALIREIESDHLPLIVVVRVLRDHEYLRTKVDDLFSAELVPHEWHGDHWWLAEVITQRLIELGAQISEQDLHNWMDRLIQLEEWHGGINICFELIQHMKDKDYLRSFLGEFGRLDHETRNAFIQEWDTTGEGVSHEVASSVFPRFIVGGGKFEDWAAYYHPFDSIPCHILRKLDPNGWSDVVNSSQYRYETRLLALSMLPTLDDVELDHILELLHEPYNYDEDRNEDYDYGQSGMRVGIITSGRLDHNADALEKLGDAALDRAVREAADRRLRFLERGWLNRKFWLVGVPEEGEQTSRGNLFTSLGDATEYATRLGKGAKIWTVDPSEIREDIHERLDAQDESL